MTSVSRPQPRFVPLAFVCEGGVVRDSPPDTGWCDFQRIYTLADGCRWAIVTDASERVVVLDIYQAPIKNWVPLPGPYRVFPDLDSAILSSIMQPHLNDSSLQFVMNVPGAIAQHQYKAPYIQQPKQSD